MRTLSVKKNGWDFPVAAVIPAIHVLLFQLPQISLSNKSLVKSE